jgi:hypothetical protein
VLLADAAAVEQAVPVMLLPLQKVLRVLQTQL